jgi:hypothetical protein
MTMSKVVIAGCVFLLGVSLVSQAQAQSSLKSPDDVRKALATLNRVVGHTQRLMDAKNYDRLPHESGEFDEGSEALQKSIANESTAFKARIVPLLKIADSDSEALAAAAKSHDDAQLASVHSALAADVKNLIAAFPTAVQPSP